jgi:MATE family multidrug resistance protein
MNIVASIGQQRKLLLLALPMILSNITTPLLGMVDTAVIGHLAQPYYLGGIAVGSMIISIIFWLAGFLRMSTTGVVSQSLGANNISDAWRYFFHSIMIAIVLATLLLLTKTPIINAIMAAMDASDEVSHYARVYFDIRIFSAPAALINLVVLGFFVARQNVKWVLYQLFTINIINIALDILFVIGFEWGVAGAAYASVIADYCGLILLLAVLLPQIRQLDWRVLLCPSRLFFYRLFNLNKDIFIRSLALQFCLGFVTITGAALGDVTVAANAILLNLFMFASYGLDGFAYAAEALVGEAKGEKDNKKLHQVVMISGFWSAVVGVLFGLVLVFWGQAWISLLTDLTEVRAYASQYIPWLIAICMIGWLTFLMDGVYIGLTRSKQMRDSMLLSCVIFFAVWFSVQDLLNHGLWLAFLCFITTRSLTLAIDYTFYYRRGGVDND